MKKNILGALVIFFVTFAFILVINELTSERVSEDPNEEYYSNIE